MSRLQKIKEKNNSSGNLVHSRTEQQEISPKRGYGYLVLFTLLIVLTIYLIFFSKLFQLKKIEVRGSSHTELVENMAHEKGREHFYSDNLFLYDSDNLAKAIKGDSRVKDIKIKRILPGKLIIEIEESTAAIVWNTAGERYLIDNRGVVIGKAKDEKLTEVYDAANISIESGGRVASPTFINFINNINANFTGITGVQISRINIFDILTDVHILTADGWTVYLDATKSSEAQLRNLTKVLEEAKKQSKRLEYIDMRLESKIYYK